MILILLVILIAVLSIGFLFNSTDNKVEVGSTYFSLPSGFEQESMIKEDNFVAVNITNGKNTIKIVEYKNTNVKNLIDNYIKIKNQDNHTVKVETLEIDSKPVYKSTDTSDSKIIHYWFEKNNKVYEIYSWDANSNTAGVIEKLISSV